MASTDSPLLTGFRRTKTHAVDPSTPRNRALAQYGEGVSLCGWGVTVGELPFQDLPGLSCRVCSRMAAAVAYPVDPAETLPVGHIAWQVERVEFSVSRRGWLRALVTHAGGQSWASILGEQPEWFEELIDVALGALPEARRPGDPRH